MGFLSGIGSTISNVFKGASSAVKTFGKDAIMKKADPTGGWLSTAISIGSSLMEKKAGGSGEWSPVDTSAGISVPSTGSYTMGFKKAGSAIIKATSGVHLPSVNPPNNITLAIASMGIPASNIAITCSANSGLDN